jgi:hypothetical protein
MLSSINGWRKVHTSPSRKSLDFGFEGSTGGNFVAMSRGWWEVVSNNGVKIRRDTGGTAKHQYAR